MLIMNKNIILVVSIALILVLGAIFAVATNQNEQSEDDLIQERLDELGVTQEELDIRKRDSLRQNRTGEIYRIFATLFRFDNEALAETEEQQSVVDSGNKEPTNFPPPEEEVQFALTQAEPKVDEVQFSIGSICSDDGSGELVTAGEDNFAVRTRLQRGVLYCLDNR